MDSLAAPLSSMTEAVFDVSSSLSMGIDKEEMVGLEEVLCLSLSELIAYLRVGWSGGGEVEIEVT